MNRQNCNVSFLKIDQKQPIPNKLTLENGENKPSKSLLGLSNSRL